MRNAIGGAWLLGIVLTFMSIFIAYISISYNYSNAFQMKTKMLTIVEEYEGINSTSLQKIDKIINAYSYRSKGKCPSSNFKYIGVTNMVVTRQPQDKQSYCIYREDYVDKNGNKKYYYNILVFFNLSLPVFGDMFTFKVESETNAVEYPNDPYF